MSTLETFETIIESKYQELATYTKIFNKKAEEDKTRLAASKDLFQANPEDLDLEALGLDVFYLNGFHQLDLRQMQERLLTAYNFYRELGGDKVFEEELENTVGVLRNMLPKQMFVISEGKLQEIEAGSVEKLKNDYKEKGYYKLFEKQIKQVLGGE